MPRNGVKISAIAVIRVIVFILIAYTTFISYTRVYDFLTTDSTFTIKNVLIESSIQFIELAPLKALKGRNIFDVDIVQLQNRLAARYPQITHLRVVRELPDRIKILAKRRELAAQVRLKDKYLLIDTHMIAVIYVANPIDVPMIIGTQNLSRVKLGSPVSGILNQVLFIIKTIQQTHDLNVLKLDTIDISNSAKIILTLKSLEAKLIIDNERIAEKLNILTMLLNQKKLDLNNIDYIDLRFEQPVIASKQEENLKRKK